MKKDIHPKYYKEAKVTCACGHTFIVGSTKEKLDTELCSLCHPFYTGTQKLVDAARRVDKFKQRLAKKDKESTSRQGKKVKRAKRAAVKKSESQKERKVKSEE